MSFNGEILQRFGFTRSAYGSDHVLSTPETFVRTSFPGLTNAVAIVHISPARGAAFAQYSLEMEAHGVMEAGAAQRFVYVLSGDVRVEMEGEGREMNTGSYAYFPEHRRHRICAMSPARLAVIEKPYQEARDMARPEVTFGDEPSLPPQFLNDDPWLAVRSLLPDDARFDFAVNTMTYHPGATLPAVEIHVMEHGLLMLEGGGIYRLGDCWYPVATGDFIWMASYCPQWFGALGKTPSKYLIYKDFHRGPLACK